MLVAVVVVAAMVRAMVQQWERQHALQRIRVWDCCYCEPLAIFDQAKLIDRRSLW